MGKPKNEKFRYFGENGRIRIDGESIYYSDRFVANLATSAAYLNDDDRAHMEAFRDNLLRSAWTFGEKDST